MKQMLHSAFPMGRLMKLILISCLATCVFATAGNAQTTLYYKGTGALNDVASWGISPDGSGGNAGLANFLGNNFTYFIQNTTSILFDAGTWTVDGTGTKVVLGNTNTPVAPITLTIAAGSVISTAGQKFDVATPSSGNNKIVYRNNTIISVGTISDSNLELVFDGAVITTSTSRTYGNVSLINGANIDISGAIEGPIVNNLTIDEGCTLTGPVRGSNTWIGIKNTGVVTINGTFRAGRTGGLFTAGVSFPITGSTTFGTLLFNAPTVSQGTNLILGPKSTIDYYRGTTGQTATQTVQPLVYANLTLSNASITNSKIFGTGDVTITGLYTINLIGNANITTASADQNFILRPGARMEIISFAPSPANVTGKFTLQSNASGTASIGRLPANVSFSNPVVVQQFIPGGFRRYRFLSHPFNAAQPLSQLTDEIDITGNPDGTTGVQGQTAGPGFTTTASNNPSAYFFRTTDADGGSPDDAGWKAFTSASSATWGVGQGIRVLTRGTKGQSGTLDATEATPNAVTLEMSGGINTGNVSVSLVTGGTGATAGFNLVGNPYPSPVNIGAVLTAAGAAVGNALYVRNPQSGAYITVSPIPASYVLPAYSAFFVQCLSPVNLQFTEAQKQVCVSCPVVFSAKIDSSRVEVEVWENNRLVDNLVVHAARQTATERTRMEATKMWNEHFNLYATGEKGSKLAALASVPGQVQWPLGVQVQRQTGERKYTLRVNATGAMANKGLKIYDAYTGVTTSLNGSAGYTFTAGGADARQSGDRRFTLIMEK